MSTPLPPGLPPPQPGSPPGYPASLQHDRATRDGSTVLVRPIRPDDARGLRELHSRLSAWSIYLRFFGAHPVLSDAEVERFTTVDYEDRLALVVEVGDCLIAVGRYDRVGDRDAEVAFVVADDHQHRGVGSLLLEELAAAARERGIRAFVAQTLVDNSAMMDVFLGSGFHPVTTTRGGVVELRFAVDKEDASAPQASAGGEPPC